MPVQYTGPAETVDGRKAKRAARVRQATAPLHFAGSEFFNMIGFAVWQRLIIVTPWKGSGEWTVGIVVRNDK